MMQRATSRGTAGGRQGKIHASLRPKSTDCQTPSSRPDNYPLVKVWMGTQIPLQASMSHIPAAVLPTPVCPSLIGVFVHEPVLLHTGEAHAHCAPSISAREHSTRQSLIPKWGGTKAFIVYIALNDWARHARRQAAFWSAGRRRGYQHFLDMDAAALIPEPWSCMHFVQISVPQKADSADIGVNV